jgi:hypothetical protein
MEKKRRRRRRRRHRHAFAVSQPAEAVEAHANDEGKRQRLLARGKSALPQSAPKFVFNKEGGEEKRANHVQGDTINGQTDQKTDLRGFMRLVWSSPSVLKALAEKEEDMRSIRRVIEQGRRRGWARPSPPKASVSLRRRRRFLLPPPTTSSPPRPKPPEHCDGGGVFSLTHFSGWPKASEGPAEEELLLRAQR